jgi:hypothetical protein
MVLIIYAFSLIQVDELLSDGVSVTVYNGQVTAALCVAFTIFSKLNTVVRNLNRFQGY